MTQTNPRVLYVYPSRMSEELGRVQTGAAPTDRFFGLIELRNRGWHVDFLDARFERAFTRMSLRLRNYVNLVDPATVAAMRRYDVIVAKNGLSTTTVLAARLARRPLVYLDALFALPVRPWRRLPARLALQGASRTVAFSHRQIDLWARTLHVSPDRFQYLPYTINLDFYPSLPLLTPAAPAYALSVGRDPGRDFETLAAALEGTGLHLKLVSLPYLTRGVEGRHPWVQVLERVSYPELFRLYTGASVVVVPLKQGTNHLSGLRGMLESMALGRPLVVTRTPGLAEYASDEEVAFVPPGDPGALRGAIQTIRSDAGYARALTERAGRAVRERNGMDSFIDGFERLLRSV